MVKLNVIKAFEKYRKEANITQEELALSCGLDRTYIGLLERAKRQPTITTIFTKCRVLLIQPHDMIKEVEEALNNNI